MSCVRVLSIGGFPAASMLVLAIVFFAKPASPRRADAGPQRAQSTLRVSLPPRARPDVARFRARVDAVLATAGAERAFWGILVADRDTGDTLYELNADRFFAPASNAKMFTTSMALATLGPAYQFHTTLESNGILGAGGRLAGDLILVGRGDPDLSNRKFPYVGKVERDGPVEKVLAELADAAVAKGLKEVDGDIVGDDSYFPYDPYPAGWSVGDLFFTFGAPVSAISFNDNSLSINVLPGARVGDPAVLTVEPAAAAQSFSQDVRTVAGSDAPDFSVVRQAGGYFILLRGAIPLGHAPIELDLAMTDPADAAGRALKQLLEARGVRITGSVRVQHAPPPQTAASGLPPAPPAIASTTSAAHPTVLAEHVSPPLLEDIRLTNKVSQNLHAELLLRTVAHEKWGVGSTDAGLAVERKFLASAGIAESDVVLSDGSGLSRDDLVTPRAVVQLLRYAAKQPWGEEFISTFPIAGVDGTLEDRMKRPPASGLIQAKTGSLEHVHAISGYVTTLRGEYLVFSIFGNNDAETGHNATAALDAICAAMVEALGTKSQGIKHK